MPQVASCRYCLSQSFWVWLTNMWLSPSHCTLLATPPTQVVGRRERWTHHVDSALKSSLGTGPSTCSHWCLMLPFHVIMQRAVGSTFWVQQKSINFPSVRNGRWCMSTVYSLLKRELPWWSLSNWNTFVCHCSMQLNQDSDKHSRPCTQSSILTASNSDDMAVADDKVKDNSPMTLCSRKPSASSMDVMQTSIHLFPSLFS
jgi:hypothetical protein